jgi:hypothetical protein
MLPLPSNSASTARRYANSSESAPLLIYAGRRGKAHVGLTDSLRIGHAIWVTPTRAVTYPNYAQNLSRQGSDTKLVFTCARHATT